MRVKVLARKSQISQILPRTEVIKSGIFLIWQRRMMQILQKMEITELSFLHIKFSFSVREKK
jgi:hypothetical protein